MTGGRLSTHLRIPNGLGSHALLLLPLAMTQLLQRLEHVVDNRFMVALGPAALTIHSVQYNFFLVGQAIGLASATSALIFWRRKEVEGHQGTILRWHLLLPFILGVILAGLALPALPWMSRYFGIQAELQSLSVTYLGVGLANMVLQAIYAPINAILIAADRRMTSVTLIGGVLLFKCIIGALAVSALFPGGSESLHVERALMTISFGTTAALVLFGGIGLWLVRRLVDGWRPFSFKALLPVWSSELGIMAVRSISPLIFTFQLAKAVASSGFFVTHQLTLHLAYFLTLPLLSGAQIAIRDASAELSGNSRSGSWWYPFLWASLIPTLLLLFIGASVGPSLFKILYDYTVPADHQPYLPLYFSACMIGQIGNVFLIEIRAAKKNWLATRNFVLAELGVQIGLTQILLFFGLATPFWIGMVIVAYCTAYFALNRLSAAQLDLTVPVTAEVSS